MPTVIIHIPSGILIFDKPILVKEIRKAMEEILVGDGSPADFEQVILYETLPQHRSITAGKNSSFIFIEILMQTGMEAVVKKQLMQSLCTKVSELTELPVEAVNCCVTEYAAENWFAF